MVEHYGVKQPLNGQKVPPAVNQFKKKTLTRTLAKAKGKTMESKKFIIVMYGLNHVTYLIEHVIILFLIFLIIELHIVVIVHDVDPIKPVVWLPHIFHKKIIAVLCLASMKNEDKLEFSKILEAVKFDKHRKRCGGGIIGSKSQAKTEVKKKLLAKEVAQRMS
ncbi:hypothetical protein P3X46_012252 [Hevea brasiliensis]|uniref:Ribosomal protein L7Ae/L30e/S12e/Gadd45 domain-containing protein n=1 Tax=Hevea brasiliensis TaxID=3981 RepID=A0ABQ9MDB3_HEVBR|nr:hypothetical protein P3X46_012252 [Hevea brasiliensis]